MRYMNNEHMDTGLKLGNGIYNLMGSTYYVTEPLKLHCYYQKHHIE